MTLRQQLLAALADGWATSSELVALVDHPGPNTRAVVWCKLLKMERAGQVRREYVTWPDARDHRRRQARWSLTWAGRSASAPTAAKSAMA